MVMHTGSLKLNICVVIPAYKVKAQILEVVNGIGEEVDHIIVVDDACPEKSGEYLKANIKDSRVEVIQHSANLGVGGAVKTGYKRALELGYEIIVKVDGDGQMDTSRIIELIAPIDERKADYTKGNRFADVEAVIAMPKVRIIGNLGLSFLTKLSSGYWRVFDPNNGFTAIHGETLTKINLAKIDNRYFFESDMLFRLNLTNAKIRDISIPAIYNTEKSNLKISRVLFEFPYKHFRNFVKRIIYSYYLRDFNLASVELPLGLFLLTSGIGLGAIKWSQGISHQIPTQPGTLILISTSILAGIQFLLAFLNYDMANKQK